MSTGSNNHLDRLYREVIKLPPEMQPELLRHLNAAKVAEGRRRKTVGLVQEALQQLRLDMKYLLFDLHCTRKERDEAKKT